MAEPLVGVVIVVGSVLIVAPLVLIVEVDPHPLELYALTLTYTRVPYVRLNGEALRVLIGIVQVKALIIVALDPSQ